MGTAAGQAKATIEFVSEKVFDVMKEVLTMASDDYYVELLTAKGRT